jgi:hypothetical protein
MGVPPVHGRAAIQQHYARAGGALSLRALAFATSGDVGYIIGAFATAKGAPDAGKFTLTLKKDAGGRWLIMSDMDNGNSRGPGPGSAAVADALPRATPESVGLAPAHLQEATDMLRRFVTEGKIAGAVAGVARKGKAGLPRSRGIPGSRNSRADDAAVALPDLFHDEIDHRGGRHDAPRGGPLRPHRSGLEIPA